MHFPLSISRSIANELKIYICKFRIRIFFEILIIICCLNLSILNPANALNDQKVSLTCVWTVYKHMTESFLVDLKKENVLWVEEETLHKISQLTGGFIKFSGTKSNMLSEGNIDLSNVSVDFKINRINGNFEVISDQVKTDRVGSCVVGRFF